MLQPSTVLNSMKVKRTISYGGVGGFYRFHIYRAVRRQNMRWNFRDTPEIISSRFDCFCSLLILSLMTLVAKGRCSVSDSSSEESRKPLEVGSKIEILPPPTRVRRASFGERVVARKCTDIHGFAYGNEARVFL